MPFPSSGCRVCVARRIRCDERRPSCARCERAGRECPGYEQEPGGLQFRAENAFAGGLARRLRKKRGAKIGNIDDIELQNLPLTNAKSTSSASSRRVPPPTASLPIDRPAGAPLEAQAISEFLHYFTDTSAISDCIWGYLHLAGSGDDLNASDAVSGLNLAISITSLCFFGQRRSNQAATSVAREKYVLALVKVNLAMSNPALAVADEVLTTVVLLGNYEATVGNFDAPSLFSGSFRHMDGAMALLKLRQGQTSSVIRDKSLDRDIRKQIIRQALFRGNHIPDWLQDGESFGEHGLELTLDKCLIATVQLRLQILTFTQQARHLSPATEELCMLEAQQLLLSAQTLDEALESWALSLPKDFKYATNHETNVDRAHDASSFHAGIAIYTSIWHATLWNRYRGARLIANYSIGRAIRFLARNRPAELLIDMRTQIKQAVSTQSKLVDDVLASVPFFFSDTRTHASPRKAYALVWPLVIAGSAPAITEHQRDLLNSKLKAVSDTTGNSTLGILARINLHVVATAPTS